MKKYTQEEREFLKKYIPGHYPEDVQAEFEKKFGSSLTFKQLQNFKGNNGVYSGIDTKFKKGYSPANKGKKLSQEAYKRLSKTMFKKGQRSQNYRPPGSERVNVDGYVEIKIKDPNIWALKHRVIWEKHNGAIPSGSIIIFKDNNPLNLNINNLLLVSKAENMKINQMGGAKYIGEAKEVIASIAKLDLLTKRKRNDKE